MYVVNRLIPLLAAASLPAFGNVENTWQGANTTKAESAADVDVSSPALWSEGRVPTTGDIAKFSYANANSAPIYISEADTAFNPSELNFYGGDWNSSQKLYLDKSLTLEKLTLSTYGSANGGGGGLFGDRFRIGKSNPTGPVILTLTGNGDALDLTQSNGNWALINCGNSQPVTIDFTGSDISFSRHLVQRHGNIAETFMGGGTSTENETLSLNPTIKFSNPTARIFLEDQGVCGPSIAPGNANFQVCSTQTWVADTNTYVYVLLKQAPSGVTPRPIVESLDGGRLDNLGQVNFLVNRNGTSGSVVPVLGGTYGSFYLRGGNTTLRSATLALQGDTTLASACVSPPTSSTVPAEASAYSLLLDIGSSAGSDWIFEQNGHRLTLAKGLRISASGYSGRTLQVHALDATLDIGGDYEVVSKDYAATNSSPYRSLGIRANAGTVVNLGGSFLTNCRAMYAAANSSNNKNNNNFSLCTVNLVGGAETERTFEVGDAAATTGIQRNTFSISNLCVGVAAKAGNVRLVNDYLNENDASAWVEGEDKNDYRAGEKLIVHELSVGPGSTLSVNGQNVEVGRSLALDATGVLDMSTGARLDGRTVLTNFYGLGDQTAAWNAVAGRVVDSANRACCFTAVYDSAADKTYWCEAPCGTVIFIL